MEMQFHSNGIGIAFGYSQAISFVIVEIANMIVFFQNKTYICVVTRDAA